MKPRVTLVNHTHDPLATVWLLWEASKVDGPVPLSIEEVRQTVSQKQLEDLFWKVIRQQIPVGEDIDFTFMMEGVSVSWREQSVRHRIGCRAGDNYGVDIVPDVATSTWWSQSMRIQNMGEFADKEMYRIPESLEGKTCQASVPGLHGASAPVPAEALYTHVMYMIQDAYKALVQAGVPMEDARELIPLGAQHRISWKLNLQSLLHVLGKRGCWILQAGLWAPIIHGMVDELCAKVHPMFRKIVHPPCIGQDGKFGSCLYRLENQRRVTGDDAHPICPLYLCRDEDGQKQLNGRMYADQRKAAGLVETRSLLRDAQPIEAIVDLPRMLEMRERAKTYEALWGADPYTWDGK